MNVRRNLAGWLLVAVGLLFVVGLMVAVIAAANFSINHEDVCDQPNIVLTRC